MRWEAAYVRRQADELRAVAVAIQAAAGSAFGSVKPEQFKAFLDALKPAERVTPKTIAQFKAQGLPIEETV